MATNATSLGQMATIDPIDAVQDEAARAAKDFYRPIGKDHD
jgi:hypothetical protein